MPALSLMELSEREAAWLDALTQVNEDGNPISEEEQARIIDEYVQADASFKDKVDRYVDLIWAFGARADYQSMQASHYDALSRSNESVANKLRARLKVVMELRGESSIETDNHRLRLVNNGGKAPLVVPTLWKFDPTQAPERFHRRRIELDLNAIRDAVEAGEQIEGCAIAERGKSLRVL